MMMVWWQGKYSADGHWYEGRIKQVIHGGYPNAKFVVVYSDYGNEEELCWRDIKFLEAASSPSGSSSEGEEGDADEEEKQEGASPVKSSISNNDSWVSFAGSVLISLMVSLAFIIRLALSCGSSFHFVFDAQSNGDLGSKAVPTSTTAPIPEDPELEVVNPLLLSRTSGESAFIFPGGVYLRREKS